MSTLTAGASASQGREVNAGRPRLSRRCLLRAAAGVALWAAGRGVTAAQAALPPGDTGERVTVRTVATFPVGGVPTGANGTGGLAPDGPLVVHTVAAMPVKGVAARTAVQLWHHFGGSWAVAFERMVAEFNAAQPDVEVQARAAGPADLPAAFAAGRPPDAFTLPDVVRPEWAAAGLVAALDPYGQPPDDLVVGYRAAITFDGAWYAVPLGGSVAVLVYNPDLLRAAQVDAAKTRTWEDLASAAQRLTRPAERRWGLTLPTTAAPWTAQVWRSFLLQAGGDLVTADGARPAFQGLEGQKALEFWVGLRHRLGVLPPGTFDAAGALSAFATGAAGLAVVEHTRLPSLAAQGFTPVAVPLPGENRQGAHLAGWYLALAGSSRRGEALWRFADWWLLPHVQARWCAATGQLPVRWGTRDVDTYRPTPGADESLGFAWAPPAVAGLEGMAAALAEALAAALDRRQVPQAALQQAAERSAAALERGLRDRSLSLPQLGWYPVG